ncbi:hypothetical protein [Vibrio barjaei]|uniref:hypothetical protein n=1 Tax=Vibrio barjaei TaxID=1676683 RepID=UPI0022836A71|nr:hypothetical protein [Vibrio barjaei]MCY9873819.1 hypothetical protein [Vibrio barjaei]
MSNTQVSKGRSSQPSKRPHKQTSNTKQNQKRKSKKTVSESVKPKKTNNKGSNTHPVKKSNANKAARHTNKNDSKPVNIKVLSRSGKGIAGKRDYHTGQPEFSTNDEVQVYDDLTGQYLEFLTASKELRRIKLKNKKHMYNLFQKHSPRSYMITQAGGSKKHIPRAHSR